MLFFLRLFRKTFTYYESMVIFNATKSYYFKERTKIHQKIGMASTQNAV